MRYRTLTRATATTASRFLAREYIVLFVPRLLDSRADDRRPISINIVGRRDTFKPKSVPEGNKIGHIVIHGEKVAGSGCVGGGATREISFHRCTPVDTGAACVGSARRHGERAVGFHTGLGIGSSSSSGGGGGGRCLPPICPTLGGALPPAENSYVASFPRARSLSRPLSITSIYQSFARLSTFFVNITTI